MNWQAKVTTSTTAKRNATHLSLSEPALRYLQELLGYNSSKTIETAA